MLMQATLEDVKTYGELAYRLALDPAKSGYPTYADGIKTQADFFRAAEQAVTDETAELLLFCVEGKVEGWISFYWIPEDRYLQLTGFQINRNTRQALAELLERIETRFAGYTAYFGYSEDNREAICAMEEQGFHCIERDWNHSFFFDGYAEKACPVGVEPISAQNFDRFRAVYHPDPDTYWTADRILETVDDWIIFVSNREDIPVAAVFLRGENGYYEIIGTAFADGVCREALLRELLTAALGECKRRGASYLTFFCEDAERAVLRELGFRCVGQYVLYIKAL